MLALACIALSAAPASLGVRVAKTREGWSWPWDPKAPGVVDGLYTFGAPAGGDPGLKNWRNGTNGCFPGLRVVSTRGDKFDSIPVVNRLMGYGSTQMEYMSYDVETFQMARTTCTEETKNLPNGGVGDILFNSDIELHKTYPNPGLDGLLGAMFLFGGTTSKLHDYDAVNQQVRSIGWRLVHSAFCDGRKLYGGPAENRQVSHLLQHPDTLDCAVTFEGTESGEGVLANINAFPVRFCDLPELVHKGFRDHLRHLIYGSDWQNNMRPQLKYCSKVYMTGMGLGGVMAELFTACASNAPERQIDYHTFKWTKSTPKQLKYME